MFSSNIHLECRVALLSVNRNVSKSVTIKWLEQIGQSEPKIYQREIKLLFSTVDVNIMISSLLRLSGEVEKQHRYWCQLDLGTKDIFRASSVTTIEPFDFYQTLPSCPNDITFHLAETACAERNFSIKLNPTPTPDVVQHCSSSNDSDTNSPVNTNALSTLALSIGLPILLSTLLLIVALAILLLARRRLASRVAEKNTSEFIFYKVVLLLTILSVSPCLQKYLIYL